MNKPAAKTKPSSRKRPRTVTKKMRACHSYTISSDWSDLGNDRIPRWPSLDDARTVEVRISSWAGVCPGASHIHVTVEMHRQQYWCEDRNCWMEIYSDSQAPYNLRASVPREGDAVRLAKEFIEIINLDKSQLWQFTGDTQTIES